MLGGCGDCLLELELELSGGGGILGLLSCGGCSNMEVWVEVGNCDILFWKEVVPLVWGREIGTFKCGAVKSLHCCYNNGLVGFTPEKLSAKRPKIKNQYIPKNSETQQAVDPTSTQ